MTLEDKSIYYCKLKDDCLFFKQPQYHTTPERKFFYDFCMHGGKNCGMLKFYEQSQRIRERTERLKNQTDFPRDKRTWRSK